MEISLEPKQRTRKTRKKTDADYVDNEQFSIAVSDYVAIAKNDIAKGLAPPMVPNYIAECFLKICNGLSRAPSFTSYTYREDMVMDGVENCLKGILNYDKEKPTRTGKPNPFSYFTQMTFFAFLRRIEKEKKHTKIKQALAEQGCIDSFADFDENSDMHSMVGESMVERIRQKTDTFYKTENELAPIFEISKPKRMPTRRSAKKEVHPLAALFEFDYDMDDIEEPV